MNGLSEFLVNSIIKEQTTALFGGGFKPPTKGHLEVILQGLNKNPKVNKLIIAVGRKPRGGITQEQSVQIWEVYKRLIPVETEIIPVISPFNFYKTFLRENKEDNVYVFIGARKNNKEDIIDIKERSKFVKRYSDNVIPKGILTENGDSGTNSRKLLKENLEGFYHTLPSSLTEEEKFQVHQILEGERLQKYIEKAKKGFKKFIAALKQEKQETKEAFKLLSQSVKGEKQLSKEEKKEIGNQMKDVLKVAGFTAASVLPGGVIYLILSRIPTLKKSLTPSAFLTENKNPLYHDFQIRINPNEEMGISFLHKDGKIQKSSISVDDNPLILNYRNIPGMIKAAYKLKNNKSEIVIWNDEGKGKTYPFTSESIKLIKKQSLNEASEDKILYAFDLDDTLITSKSDVIITNPERGTFKLTPAEYALYEPGPNDEFDFSEFKYLKSPKVIKDNFELFSKILEKSSQLSGAKTIILTARQPEVATDLEAFLEKKNLPQVTLHAVGSSDPNKKLKVVQDYINQGFNKIRFYDDSPKNIKSIQSLSSPEIDVKAKLVKHGPLSEGNDPFGLKSLIKEVFDDSFDYKTHIDSLNSYMEDKGMNVTPLPSLVFIHDDVENAQDVMGKTAFYDPNKREIVLYTLYRHPKDVLRSYAHEMIHHIQNLEDRLGNITTTDTREDDHLTNIEREAYTDGNLTFRKWTETLTESQKSTLSLKDSFEPQKENYKFDCNCG